MCVRNNKLVEFRKHVGIDYDFCGESVGFFRFNKDGCRLLMETCERYTSQTEECYEEVLREVMLNAPEGMFGYEDVTGLPWTEIDFPEDIEKARFINLEPSLEINPKLPY